MFRFWFDSDFAVSSMKESFSVLLDHHRFEFCVFSPLNLGDMYEQEYGGCNSYVWSHFRIYWMGYDFLNVGWSELK